jgi:hypothetical protein
MNCHDPNAGLAADETGNTGNYPLAAHDACDNRDI